MRICTLVLLTFAAGDLSAQTPTVRPFSARIAQQIDALFNAYGTAGPGYAVGVIQNGKLVHARGYGLANLEYAQPITPQSVFNVASLAKQFTAAAIALLVIDRRVTLEDEVGKFIANWPAAYRAVRIKHLIYMTSGVPEYYRQERPGGGSWERDYFTVDDALAASGARGKLDFEPGTAWAYSNVNYMLLARIVERVSGESFASFTDRRIFQPLGMTSTHFNDDVTRVVRNRVTGYNIREGGGFHRHERISPHYGGSGLFTTVEDLARWDENFYTHQLGGPRLSELMLSTMRFAHNKANDAFGLVWGAHRGLRSLWYEGGDVGFSSYMVRFPDARLSVIVLSNLGTGNAAQKAREVLNQLIEP